ncbi:hypothetical protein [Leptolyngbya sp. FACHB-541]|nr:hypothetical protein [Leptolyngbya sp. FACHB-541]
MGSIWGYGLNRVSQQQIFLKSATNLSVGIFPPQTGCVLRSLLTE